jgi:D-alanine-D-alanine ligase
VGLFIIHDQTSLQEALQKLTNDNGAYLAERFITGREITVGVRQRLNGELEALPCSEVRVLQGRQFDYEGKYLGHGVQELTPAPITPEETLRCQELALKLHQAAGCEGYSRTDMILTERGPILLEINTLPGLSKASFVPQQIAVLGVTLRDFFAEQILLAEKRLSGK